MVKCYNRQEEVLMARQCTKPKRPKHGLRRRSVFHTNDLVPFDSDCDDRPFAKAILMANLSFYDSDVLSEVTNHDINLVNDMSYQSMQETQCSEQPSFDNETDFGIISDSNIISYECCGCRKGILQDILQLPRQST
ncbi:hypothetical protein Tco_1431514 [Tanacetum coccineum]